jgi:YHS domain-containing protein
MFPPDFGWIFLPLLIYGMSALMHRLRRRQVGSDQFPQNTRNESVPEAAIYRVAQKHGGRLTVSELIIDTGLPSEEVEKLLQAMSDGTHVRMDVSRTESCGMNFPKSSHGQSRRRKAILHWRKKMAIDPICKMEVEEKTAKWTSEYEGKTYYFCAPGCKKEFESNPKKYQHEDKK